MGVKKPEKFWDDTSLKGFNEDAERAKKYYEESKSKEYKKEQQEKIDDWRKAMETAWFPKSVTLEISNVKISRWKGIFKNLSWKYGIIKWIKSLWFSVKLSMNQNIRYKQKQKLIIQGFDTNDKWRKVEFVMNNREFFTKLFTKNERLYVYRDVYSGEICIKKAKNLRDLYKKVGIYKIESLGWLPIDIIEELKKITKE